MSQGDTKGIHPPSSCLKPASGDTLTLSYWESGPCSRTVLSGLETLRSFRFFLRLAVQAGSAQTFPKGRLFMAQAATVAWETQKGFFMMFRQLGVGQN